MEKLISLNFLALEVSHSSNQQKGRIPDEEGCGRRVSVAVSLEFEV